MAEFRIQLIDRFGHVLGDRDVTAELSTEVRERLLDATVEAAQAFEICLNAGGDIWGEDPSYSRNDWIHAVADGATNLGYWPWVLHRHESRSKRNGV